MKTGKYCANHGENRHRLSRAIDRGAFLTQQHKSRKSMYRVANTDQKTKLTISMPN